MKTQNLDPAAELILFDPARDAYQVGIREITGDIPSTGERILLRAWAVIFPTPTDAETLYQETVAMLGTVDGDGHAITSIEDMPAERFGNMSERTDLIGQTAIIWISASEDSDARGALMVSLDGDLLQVLALSSYIAEGADRAVFVAERISQAMAARQSTVVLPARNATMERLPILGDCVGSLDDASVVFNRYFVQQ